MTPGHPPPTISFTKVPSDEHGPARPDPETAAQTRKRLRIAKLTTEVLAPWVWVLTVPLAIAWPATGHHVANREGRLIPLLACIDSVALGLLVILVGDGPHEVIALTVAMLVCLVVRLAITHGAKIMVSFHAAVPVGVVVTPVALLVAWSRIEINNADPGKGHILREAVLGTVVGALIGGSCCWTLTSLLGSPLARSCG